MSKSKIEEDQLTEMFKALGNTHRLMIFKRLSRCCQPGTQCDLEQAIAYSVGELGEGLDIASSTLSHHLKELHRSGLIEMERQGKRVVCWIAPETLNTLSDFFKSDIKSQ